MRCLLLVFFAILLLQSCRPASNKYIDSKGGNIETRILLPEGYSRIVCGDSTFSAYVRHLPLLPNGTKVHYFDGSVKDKSGVYVAVIDMETGKKDLQQCADVAIHVRADYLYKSNKHDKIKFNFTSGFEAPYSKWMEGYRVSLKGNKAEWVKVAAPGDNEQIFRSYMDVIYSYCGSLSLSRELKKIRFDEIQPGDILIKGGSPGHVELVTDMAIDKHGNKIYMLAQGYMPSQQMQLLANPMNLSISPWYELKSGAIRTPECVFNSDQFMRFEVD